MACSAIRAGRGRQGPSPKEGKADQKIGQERGKDQLASRMIGIARKSTGKRASSHGDGRGERDAERTEDAP